MMTEKSERVTEKSGKIEKKFFCEICDYTCRYYSDYIKHTMTRKHKMMTNDDKNSDESCVKKYDCLCGKKYSSRQGLHRHKKKCASIESSLDEEGIYGIEESTNESNESNESNEGVINSIEDGEGDEDSDILINEENAGDGFFNEMKHMFFEAMQQNKELQQTIITQQQQISELIPKIGNTTNNTTNNNTTNNNNQFNLNFFLNEQCKDAIPLIDFVKSLQYDFDQLEYTGKHGFVEGASKIIMDAMNQLDITKRPIHCTDVKRETFYVKDDESWKKEDERNRSIKTAIHNIRNRNLACVPEWIKAHPNCKKIDDPNNDLFIEIIGQYMDASEKEFNKVIKIIAKSLTIPKNKYGRQPQHIADMIQQLT